MKELSSPSKLLSTMVAVVFAAAVAVDVSPIDIHALHQYLSHFQKKLFMV